MSREHQSPQTSKHLTGAPLAGDPADTLLESETADPALKTWSTSILEILLNDRLRLDATHYDPDVGMAKKKLEASGYELRPLSSLAKVELRGQFVRVWAEDERYGVKYLNATDLLTLMSLGVPAAGYRYLSYATETDVESLLIREGWLLMTCSGTIGRVFYVPKRLDGWAATHDLIRIIPNDPQMTGYLYAWLSTSIAQAQILSHTHGGQIDHVTDDQVGSILVPILPSDQMARIHKQTMEALQAREQAIQMLITIKKMAEDVLEP